MGVRAGVATSAVVGVLPFGGNVAVGVVVIVLGMLFAALALTELRGRATDL
jgi:hypothetical protein